MFNWTFNWPTDGLFSRHSSPGLELIRPVFEHLTTNALFPQLSQSKASLHYLRSWLGSNALLATVWIWKGAVYFCVCSAQRMDKHSGLIRWNWHSCTPPPTQLCAIQALSNLYRNWRTQSNNVSSDIFNFQMNQSLPNFADYKWKVFW